MASLGMGAALYDATTPVPEWLRTTWGRTYIRRGTPLGAEDRAVTVRYVQTRRAFVDVRQRLDAHADGSTERPFVAFAGVTMVTRDADGVEQVAWHAVHNHGEPFDASVARARWEALANGTSETADVGLTRRLAGSPTDAWLEWPPPAATPYEELWERAPTTSSAMREFAAVRPSGIVVVSGSHLALALADTQVFLVATLDEHARWTVVLSAEHASIGAPLALAAVLGRLDEWAVLDGSFVRTMAEFVA